MKKGLCFICFLCLFGLSISRLKAQPIPHLGVRLGMNFATITNGAGFGNSGSRRIGLIAGVYRNFMISKRHFSIQPEFLFSQKGVNRSVVFQGEWIRGETIKLNYFEIPVLFKYTFIPDKTVHPSVYLGPYVGFNIVAKKAFGSDIDSKIKNVDFGFSTGASIAFRRYHIGFRFTFAALGVAADNITSSHRNSVFSIVTGIDI